MSLPALYGFMVLLFLLDPGDQTGERRRMMEFIEEFTEDEVYRLPDMGNGPQCAYILRGHTWYGGDGGVDPAAIGAGASDESEA